MRESKSRALPLGDGPLLQNGKSACEFAVPDFKWGGRWDSNPRQPEPQSGALPTELHPPYLVRPKGLEPLAHCLEGSCSIHLSYGRTLLSHGVLIWRQCAFGTRCKKYNTIRIGFCQAEFQIFLDFPAQGAFWGHSSHIPAAPRAKPSRAPAATSRTKCTPASTRRAQMSRATTTMQAPAAG